MGPGSLHTAALPQASPRANYCKGGVLSTAPCPWGAQEAVLCLVCLCSWHTAGLAPVLSAPEQPVARPSPQQLPPPVGPAPAKPGPTHWQYTLRAARQRPLVPGL
ncbi:protein ELYS [Platysternon megacephalum]|uniref:Protein ELYS n=1 Tax=Platysternon megacephalum TaxID=55544 RepID=A0A4D9E118_9SAUR|nr:protein ELYS [Platysternon megacephalum]